ncbi:bifunctional (p)ppGpp synthetase/guanosine-3',5'-bis(diphosphate) 3'-pyrophosphohydrolase [Candidatus Synechococcus calcipolaris G9]|uniref:Bifunctional (P)ppGpp synthetase/guanosine-3',5'-bis(Diphosphate) 3'-pyrophosphohydrolase n=1 Tax=Candidatus Synechococcus calcipolaris G9 TaxID=1497997 RepID=A0ABT6F1F4_9SYNE|nr:bifunctional (p)ppGpp synthetase/guanosine-3',5'-bis(diphosphate) 3'-pyrophosphohydrolase [Candidatus Synechococcus calcipolaris]MDG2991657.1 bifunctional (p)ppGpp synthetase/guanosine-3',5'-bis(diphosphate) 3'-pyrophosphohydrolase [Candidatus Synechococcus calcipolaris G9]
MNAFAPKIPTDITLPDWLQSCLLEPNEDEGDNLVCHAFNFAYNLHEGQLRASGEPYIAHPVAVASLLRDLGGGPALIAAGFLHDVIEDTAMTGEDLEAEFGPEVRQLVEGVTKLSKYDFSSKTERQAESFRRMFLAMTRDIRVIVVKLADRLHNMRTLEYLSDERRRRIAQETRDVFAPLANRLGIWRVKWELEDLTFKYLEPDAYRQMQEYVAEKRVDREAQVNEAIALLQKHMDDKKFANVEITGRPKHLYSIYQKMVRQQKEFHEIYDVAGIRVLVETKGDCYQALAVAHNCFRAMPGRMKDYISVPKPNQYQSLHTVVNGLSGQPLEVQIRTHEMHAIAEFGIAAHWKYKEAGHSKPQQWTPQDERFTWLRQLLDWQNDLKDAQEYLDSVRDDLFESEVYVFTPKGEVFFFPRGATPLDFAYRIHSEVGEQCVGAKVNGRIVTIDSLLANGDIVEIITNKNSHPSLDWLNFVVTTSARNRIRQWFKRERRDENVQRGRELLEKHLGKSGFNTLLKSSQMQAVAERCNYQTPEDLLAGLGYGEIALNLVVNRIRNYTLAETQDIPKNTAETSSLADEINLLQRHAPPPQTHSNDPILGIEGLLYHLAGCCSPVPGEPIIGIVTLGSRGISIHRQGCSNIENIPGDRLIPVSWNENRGQHRPQTYPVDVQIEVIDRVGVLKDILTRLTDNQINVRNAHVHTDPGRTAMIDLCIDIVDSGQLEQTFTQIKKITDVLNLRRRHQAEVSTP